MAQADKWKNADPYEYFMGRWSRQAAPLFLDWLNPAPGLSWLDLGCGTGALSNAILSQNPADLLSVDPSSGFLEKAKAEIQGPVAFLQGDATHIPATENRFDVVASGLALNFFPDLTGAFAEILRVLKSPGTLAIYVWDYAGRMDFLRLFWDAVCEVNPNDREFDEGVRFPICDTIALEAAFKAAGFTGVRSTHLDVPVVFTDFDDFWNPFLGGQGPAPSYLVAQPETVRNKIKSAVLQRIHAAPDGTIRQLARALAVSGIRKK